VKLNRLVKSALYISIVYTIITFLFLTFWLYAFYNEIVNKIISFIISITFTRVVIMKISMKCVLINISI